MTDKYEEFKKWFKKTGFTAYAVQSARIQRGRYNKSEMEFISLDNDRLFKEFESTYKKKEDKEKIIKIIDSKLPFSDEIYEALKKEGYIK